MLQAVQDAVDAVEQKEQKIKTVKLTREQIYDKSFGQLMTKIYHHPTENNFYRNTIHRISSQIKKHGQEIMKRVEDANKAVSEKFEVQKKTPEEQNALMPQLSEELEKMLKPWMEETVDITFTFPLTANVLTGMKLSSADVDLLGELYEQVQA